MPAALIEKTPPEYEAQPGIAGEPMLAFSHGLGSGAGAVSTVSVMLVACVAEGEVPVTVSV